ncbi:170 kDa surface lectin [Entamoeba marina]
MFILVFLIVLCVKSVSMNEFTGTVDILDKGRMGMGKKCCFLDIWEWTTSDANQLVNVEDSDSYTKVIFNLDYERDESDVNEHNKCKKIYDYPMRDFELDWSQNPEDTSKIPVESINGITCYKYVAKPPLSYAYFTEKFYDTSNTDAEGMTACRFEFIGGKQVTFRSINDYTPSFVSDYGTNNITKCTESISKPEWSDVVVGVVINIDASPSLRSMMNDIKNNFFERFDDDTHFVISVEATTPIRSNVLTKDEAINLISTVTTVKRGSEKEAINHISDKMQSYAGKNIVFFSKQVGTALETINEIYSNNKNETIYVVALDASLTEQYNMISLVDKGEHYFKTTTSSVSETMTTLQQTIIANMTELCDRTSCKGFCDGGARCTCPMCCHNKCYYTTCDTSNGECVKFPLDNPMQKVVCSESNCLGSYYCDEQNGCTLNPDNEECISNVKCLSPYCVTSSTCKFKSNCQPDSKPSSDGYCHSYTCDTESGECIPDEAKESSKCSGISNSCQEYVCNSEQTCVIQEKTCVKVSPYEENPCYVATCDEETGSCITKLDCDDKEICGTNLGSCVCNEETNYVCSCNNDGVCSDDEVCDLTGDEPTCDGDAKNCGITTDIDWNGCFKTICVLNGSEWITEDVEYTCDDENNGISDECKEIVHYVCSGNKVCSMVVKDGAYENCQICEDDVAKNRCDGLYSDDGVPLTCRNGNCEPPESFDCDQLYGDNIKNCAVNYEFEYDNSTGSCNVVVIDDSIVNDECQYCSYDNILVDVAQYIDLDCESMTNSHGISYICQNGECIPDPNFDCTSLDDFPTNCIDILNVEYIQTGSYDDYHCTWSVNQTIFNEQCLTCDMTVVGGNQYNVCDEKTQETGLDFKCSGSYGECTFDSTCEHIDCYAYDLNSNSECVSTGVYMCSDDTPIAVGETICREVTCTAENTCMVEYHDDLCENSTDIGCHFNTGYCSRETGYCVRSNMTSCEEDHVNPPDDCSDLCVNYECSEELTSTSVSHTWVKTKDLHETAEGYTNSCQDAYCEADVGEIIIDKVTCDIDANFPNMSTYAKLCFYCACSISSESGWELMMYDSYDGNEFSLDACGNCIVNGEIQDPDAVCILTAEVSNTAAIAAATTVAIVVVIIVIGMVVVAIGIKQTVDIVRSARKNLIHNTTDNPEFVAADQSANNANFAG